MVIQSLKGRLIAATCLTVIIFLGFTGLALQSAFNESVEANIAKVQESKIFALVGAADDSGEFLAMPYTLTDDDLNEVTSGIYGLLYDSEGRVFWRSPSVIDTLPQFDIDAPSGEMNFYAMSFQNTSYYVTSFAVEWYGDGEQSQRKYTFLIAEKAQRYEEVTKKFRKNLWLWLAGLVLLLVVFQSVILTWGMAPLKSVVKAIKGIETGVNARIEGDYPTEIQRLTDAINLLMTNEQQQSKRYRDSLADLAHSLKTPLAVVQSTLDNTGFAKDVVENLNEQVTRMDQIIAYQLQRAQSASKKTFTKPIAVKPVVDKLANALAKVYANKNLQFSMSVDEQAKFWGDEGDLLEMLGNIVENAAKYGNSRIHIGAKCSIKQQPARLTLTVEDNGKGVDEAYREQILQRGKRLDEQEEGQGIGLSIVADIVSSYGGEICVEQSIALGGAKFVLMFER